MVEMTIVTRSKRRSSSATEIQLDDTTIKFQHSADGVRTGIRLASSKVRVVSTAKTSTTDPSQTVDKITVRMSTRSMTKTPQRDGEYRREVSSKSIKSSPESSASSLSIFTSDGASISTLSSAPSSSPPSPTLKPTRSGRVPSDMLQTQSMATRGSKRRLEMGEASSDSEVEEADLNGSMQDRQKRRRIREEKILSLKNILLHPDIPGNTGFQGSEGRTDSALSSPRYTSEYGKYAFWSRLNAYELHPVEYITLRRYINMLQATIYLNIRNKILKLWHTTLKTAITREQAAECASEPRFVELADIAWEFLVRHGYINYGCIDHPERPRSKKIVAIVGGGVSGLACARQLDYLFWQFRDRFATPEDVPQVYVIEGRDRLGGRVYSHPLRSSPLPDGDPSIPFLYNPRVDVGAQVITGLEGNPISAIIEQRDLPYHSLRPECAVYDVDGKQVDRKEDEKVEILYNDSLDRVAVFKGRTASLKPVRALNESFVDEGRDPTGDGGRTSIAEAEEIRDWMEPYSKDLASLYKETKRYSKLRPTAVTSADIKVAPAAERMRRGGWELKRGVKNDADVIARRIADENGFEVLGKSMDHIFEQYRNLSDILPLHLRLLNWHHANNEYGNACHNDNLSLEYWDQDEGNSFEGPHAILVGGYSSLVEALAEHPKPLKDVYTGVRVKGLAYDQNDLSKEVVITLEENAKVAKGAPDFDTIGRGVIEADKVIITSPLGCLKERQIQFTPELPDWKQNAIENMGFGLFNKVILIFDEPFWDMDADMFGTLREPLGDFMKLASYEANRGRFYMFWNVSKACGRPALVGLMVGEAAMQVENTTDDKLAREAMELLSNIYSDGRLPDPVEVVVTRWRQDPFSRGSYSFMAPRSCADDYDNVAKPVDGKVFFAGEATCRTHPATVHGAYISGLRAAEEVLRSYIGDITVPDPLIVPKSFIEKRLKKILPTKRKAEDEPIGRYYNMKKQRLDGYKEECQAAARDIYGEPPSKPSQPPGNPWMIFVKNNWDKTKDECDRARRRATRNPNAQSTREAVRATLSKKWKVMSPREKAPYQRESEKGRASGSKEMREYKRQLSQYETQVNAYLDIYKRKVPCPLPTEDEETIRQEAEHLIAEITRLSRLSGIQFTIDDTGNVTTTRPESNPDWREN